MLQILNFRMRRAFWENFGENCRRERQKIVPSRSRKTRMKPSKTGKPLPKSQLDFESFSLRPLRYISKYIFMANLRFVYRKSALKLGTVAVRILLENASFRQALKPVRTSKLTFPRVIWRHPAKHPLGFRVVLVTTTSIHLHIHSYIIIAKSRRSVNTFCRRDHSAKEALWSGMSGSRCLPLRERTTSFSSLLRGAFFMLYCHFQGQDCKIVESSSGFSQNITILPKDCTNPPPL